MNRRVAIRVWRILFGGLMVSWLTTQAAVAGRMQTGAATALAGDGTEAVAAAADADEAARTTHAARVLRSDRGLPATPRQALVAPAPAIQPVIVPEIRLPAGVSVPVPKPVPKPAAPPAVNGATAAAGTPSVDSSAPAANLPPAGLPAQRPH